MSLPPQTVGEQTNSTIEHCDMTAHPAYMAVASLVVLLVGFLFLQQQRRVRKRRKGDNDEGECDSKGSDQRDNVDDQFDEIDFQQEDVDDNSEDVDDNSEDVDGPREDFDGPRGDVDVNYDYVDGQRVDINTQAASLRAMDATNLDHSDSTTTLTESTVSESGSDDTTFRERSFSDVTDLMTRGFPGRDTWFHDRPSQSPVSRVVSGLACHSHTGSDTGGVIQSFNINIRMLFRRKSGYSLTSMLSSSCPALNAPVRSLTMKYINNEEKLAGYPKSMENLLQDNSPSQPSLESSEQNGFDDVDGATSHTPQLFSDDEYVDEDSSSRNQIIDSTEDFLQASGDSGQDSEDIDDRRQSWTSDELSLQSDVISQTSPNEDNSHVNSSLTSDLEHRHNYNHLLSSRSYSLTSLLEEEETEDLPVAFSKKQQRLGEFSLGSPGQVPSVGRYSAASADDSTDSGSGSEALSPGESHQQNGDFMYRPDNGLPESISEPGYRTNPDLSLLDDGISSCSTSPVWFPTDVVTEHKPHKSKLRNHRIHSSMSGVDAMLHNSTSRHGVTRKNSFMNFLRGQQKQSKAKAKETKNTTNHRFVSVSFTSDTNCDVCQQLLANHTAVRCENCLVSIHDDNCTERVSACEGSRQQTCKDSLGSSQRSNESLDLNSLSTAGVTHWGDETMREYRQTDTTSARQTTQKPEAPYAERTPPISGNSLIGPPDGVGTDLEHCSNSEPGMTNATTEPFETTDGVIPWLAEEPDLHLTAEELGDHYYTVDAANTTKLTQKDVERQSTIRELINTERHYVNRLKIMQKVFAHSMITKLKYTEHQVNKLFPRIDELVEIHEKFLHQLLSRQAAHEDRFVHEIADILLDQFQGAKADKMISAYGVFCCKYNEAVQLYKEFLKNDRNLQMFAKYCHSLPACEKREIPDFILGVTIRLSKYWILIEAILKNTKDKKERKLLDQAVQASKDVLHQVDRKVDAYEKLIHIQNRLDSKTVNFKDRKFKRQDLSANNRELVHVGIIGWMSAQGRVAEILVVVLTDIIVLLQKNEQKYTFFMQDNKSCVIPLHDLLVREKAEVKGSPGIFVISQSLAEMYELVCKSKREREEWIRTLQHAIKACRKDVGSKPSAAVSREVIVSKQVDTNRQLEVASKVTSIIKQLHEKDEIIRDCCDDKNKLMLELLQLSTANSETGSRPHSQEISGLSESVEIVFAAMKEASRLTGILQSPESHINRSISVGEHHSDDHVNTAVPRRAETFSGFDSSHGTSKVLIRNQNNANNEVEETLTHMRGSSIEVKDRRYSDTPDTILESKYEHGSHSWQMQVSCDTSSEHGSMEELSASTVLSLVPAPPTHDQMASVFQLAQYLNSLMNITTKQCTMVESLRAELVGAKEEISRLSADVHSRQSTLYRHDQLEELRQLQGNLTLEKHEWEKTKQYDCSRLHAERENLESERRQIEKDKMDLKNSQKALKKERDSLQNEFNRMKEQSLQVSRTFDHRNNPRGLENVDGSRSSLEQRSQGHHRSASEDMYDTVTVQPTESYSPYAWVGSNEFPYQPLEPVVSPEDYVSSAVRQDSYPFYFTGANYEEGIAGVSHQSLQVKSDTIPFQKQESAAVPSPSSNMPYPSFSRDISTGLSRVQSLSAVSRTAFRHKKKSNSGASDASRKEKFPQQNRKP